MEHYIMYHHGRKGNATLYLKATFSLSLLKPVISLHALFTMLYYIYNLWLQSDL